MAAVPNIFKVWKELKLNVKRKQIITFDKGESWSDFLRPILSFFIKHQYIFFAFIFLKDPGAMDSF